MRKRWEGFTRRSGNLSGKVASLRLINRLRGLLRNATCEQGQALIEYVLIVSLIALVAIIALRTTGTNVTIVLNRIAGEV